MHVIVVIIQQTKIIEMYHHRKRYETHARVNIFFKNKQYSNDDMLRDINFLIGYSLQNGNTSLHLACQNNEVDTVEILINKGVDLNRLNLVRKIYAMHIYAYIKII